MFFLFLYVFFAFFLLLYVFLLLYAFICFFAFICFYMFFFAFLCFFMFYFVFLVLNLGQLDLWRLSLYLVVPVYCCVPQVMRACNYAYSGGRNITLEALQAELVRTLKTMKPF